MINRRGVVGERANIALICSTIDSRLLQPDASGQQGIGLIISGRQGTGKSHTVEVCLKVQDSSVYNRMSTASDKSLFYMTESMKNRAIVLAEAFKLEGKGNSEFAYVLRSLLSEGIAIHRVTARNADGDPETVDKIVEGPISLITTTTCETLEKQIQSRMITASPDESSEQTKQILSKTASIAANGTKEIDKEKTEAWQRFHKELEPAQVVVPFAQDISAGVVTADLLPLDARRSFKRFLSLIKAISIVYQGQRKRDLSDRIVAETADYFMAYQILAEIFEEGIGNQNDTDIARLDFVKKTASPLQIKALTQKWGISKNAVSKWLKRFVKDGFIDWCDISGNPFPTNTDLKKAKYAGDAYFLATKKAKQSLSILLPSAFELTDDENWKEGGNLAILYGLKLN